MHSSDYDIWSVCRFVFFEYHESMVALMEHTLLPDPDGDEANGVSDLLALLSTGESITLTTGTESAALPEPVRRVLLDVLQNLSRGTAVTVAPHRTVLTTQEAADILGITRPTLVRLLEAGDIPFTTPGRHRRVQLTDVLAYQRRLRSQRQRALRSLGSVGPGQTEAGFVTTR